MALKSEVAHSLKNELKKRLTKKKCDGQLEELEKKIAASEAASSVNKDTIT